VILKKTFFQIILHFQKEMNVIMCIIEKKFKLNFNHFIWTKSQEDMNFQILCFCNVKNYVFNK